MIRAGALHIGTHAQYAPPKACAIKQLAYSRAEDASPHIRIRGSSAAYISLGKRMKCCREFNRLVKQICNAGQLTQEQVLALFMYVRQVLDERQEHRSAYPHVNTFCHWMAHPSLRDTVYMLRRLVEVSRVLSAALSAEGDAAERAATNAAIQVAGDLINIPRLRAEFVALANAEGLDPFIFRNKQAWDAFVVWMLKELTEKPIRFPENLNAPSDRIQKIAKLHAEIMALPHPRDADKIVQLVLTEGQDHKFHVQFSSPGHKITYDFELRGLEPEEAFA